MDDVVHQLVGECSYDGYSVDKGDGQIGESEISSEFDGVINLLSVLVLVDDRLSRDFLPGNLIQSPLKGGQDKFLGQTGRPLKELMQLQSMSRCR